jgi:hypothetical protein
MAADESTAAANRHKLVLHGPDLFYRNTASHGQPRHDGGNSQWTKLLRSCRRAERPPKAYYAPLGNQILRRNSGIVTWIASELMNHF